MYTAISKARIVDITYRLLERGHTQNESDSVHAIIEKNSTKQYQEQHRIKNGMF